jgi:hypothetical protein
VGAAPRCYGVNIHGKPLFTPDNAVRGYAADLFLGNASQQSADHQPFRSPITPKYFSCAHPAPAALDRQQVTKHADMQKIHVAELLAVSGNCIKKRPA